jgi:hypothetical protein
VPFVDSIFSVAKTNFTLLEDPSLFAPHPCDAAGAPSAQALFLDDYVHRYCGFVAGWGGGKTWAGARKLVNLHLFNAFDDAGRPTSVKGLAIAPTYQIALTVLVPELRQALTEADLSHRFLSDQRRFCFVLPDLGTIDRPSEILVRSAETPDRLVGFEVGHLWGDEAGRYRQNPDDPTDDAMIQAEGRLRAPNARILQANYTFTHEGDCTAVFRRFEEEFADHPDYGLYRGRSEANPLMCHYARETRARLSPQLAAQYLDGQAVNQRGGRVYSEFDANRNVDPGLCLSGNLPLHLSLDFNIDPGMHAVIGQHDPANDLLTAVYEIHEPRMDLRRMFVALRELIERDLDGWRWPMLWVFGDASGNGKWAGSGQSCWDVAHEAMRNAGFPFVLKVPRANPPVADRVNAVNCALRSFDGRVRYKVHPRCKLLLRDLKEMRWSDGSVDKSNRHLSHASDAEGYRVHYLMPIRPLRLALTGSVGFSV